MTTLEKIRAEIENIKDFEVVNGGLYVRQYDVVQIINKYAEKEPTKRQSCENCKHDRKACGNDDHYGFCQNWEYAEQEPCDDVVSRQAVLDINESHHGQMPNHINHQIWQEIKALPSVRPQEQTGRWIETDGDDSCWYMCSECNRRTDDKSDYCPNCGARMVEPQESEDKG